MSLSLTILSFQSHVETRTQHDDDLLAEKCYSRKIHRETYSHSPPVETLRRSSEISESFPTRTTADYWRSALPQRERRHESYELRDRTTKRDYAPDYDARKAVVREEYKFDEMYCKRNYRPDVGQRSDYYYPRTTEVPIQRLETDYYRSTSRPRPFLTARSKSSDMILEKEYNCRRDDGRISDVIHRFYDRDGNSINRQVKRGCDLDIRRDYSPARDKRRRSLRDSHVHPRMSKSLERRYEERHEYEEMEKRMWIPDKRVVESRDWRDVINQQRQATPGRPPDTQRIRDASSSLGNLPAIINRKLEETRKLEKEQRQTTEYGYRRTMDDRYTDIDNYDKATNYGRFEKVR
uniref:SDP_N domain-containing protein n=1 Tax=Angiostrongylus cantonensis TaxID=6313 RepID=A0A0K0D369_ANGCA